MGTLARFLAEKKIPTPEELYWADVEGDIENVNNVLKITQIRVKYHLKASQEKTQEVKAAFSSYLIEPLSKSYIMAVPINYRISVNIPQQECH